MLPTLTRPVAYCSPIVPSADPAAILVPAPSPLELAAIWLMENARDLAGWQPTTVAREVRAHLYQAGVQPIPMPERLYPLIERLVQCADPAKTIARIEAKRRLTPILPGQKVDVLTYDSRLVRDVLVRDVALDGNGSWLVWVVSDDVAVGDAFTCSASPTDEPLKSCI
jgi:hypothetical protein